MITDYESRKNEVLDSSQQLNQLIEAIKDNAFRAEMPNPLERLESLIIDIHNKSEKVRADRFCLMIAGEAKSGKSTFINAYLGVELLPMDVKQCTSAIIEIKSGKEFCVKATYADGRKEEVVGDSEAKDFLKKNAALDDEYRDIPVPTINSEILVKSGIKARAKGKRNKIRVSPHEIEDLLKAPEVQEANIHKIPTEEYNRKIRDYIEIKKNNWQDIVTKIEVVFPFSEEMRGIEIIDSPGVCARGGVAEITSQYIENADAIIFLKPVSGQALESTQFNQFMHNSSVARNKNALFLVLTRATNVTSDELRRLESEAYIQFSNLDEKNILLVDSKAELYAKKLSLFDDIKPELARLNKEGTLDDFVVKAYTETDGLFGEGDFIGKLQEKSRFNQVYNSLEVFGRKAHYILLGSLLDSICKLYGKLWNDLDLQMNMFRQKAEDPTELAKKIANVKQELDSINSKIYKGVDAVVRRFLGDEGVIRKTANKAVADFKAQVAEVDASSSDAFSELENLSIAKIDEFKKLTATLQNDVVSECDKELIALSDNSTVPFESLKPNFTEHTFKEIQDFTKSKAEEKHSYEEGVTFKKTHTSSQYSQNKHFSIIEENIRKRLDDIKDGLIDNLSKFTENIRGRYIDELSLNADAKKIELDTIMEAQMTAEKINQTVNELTTIINNISSAKSDAQKIKGGITKNVQ
ncbi:dynamin family protein [uncultured Psychromonas sp.]|uniref:dynamin family protein n=1 Tax=uncultured Psychromonas sp. TaxID=173974 RepID=UPI002638A56B|nr:dynamin family protein [uncultured Psychromonas sp.]